MGEVDRQHMEIMLEIDNEEIAYHTDDHYGNQKAKIEFWTVALKQYINGAQQQTTPKGHEQPTN